MKERVILFSDAVIAIIMTVMVVEFPVKIVNGQVELTSLFITIGIYFISFCFVANIWFQTAQRFNKVETVTNKDLVIYLFSLFLLSLVPKATDVLIEETSKSTLLMYGILTLLVVMFTEKLLNTLTEQAVAAKQTPKEEINRVRRRGIATIGARILLLVLGLFFARFSLVVYMILPILDFLQNAVDHEETEFIEQMGTEQRDFYRQDQQQFWQNNWKKYGTLLKSALDNGSNTGKMPRPDERRPDWWQNFDRQWNDRLSTELDQLTKRLNETHDEREAATIEKKIQRIKSEQDDIRDKLAETQEHFKRRQGQEQQRLQKRLDPIQEEMQELQEKLQKETDPKKQQKWQSQLDELSEKYHEEITTSNARTQQNVQQVQKRMASLSGRLSKVFKQEPDSKKKDD
ncbi:hypothetical protein RU97_GL001213 [Enterococcus canis]|uniref:Integral membrane protein n=1 Tax=Enterococcus canis TaxID=214095 RepID=A0A1L8RIV8_9ENTE|nr:TMEM175 family protein [Enterococcus canis]OJG19642.1 hypothetical protein RU97_GL001213 [Enterococcus canis]